MNLRQIVQKLAEPSTSKKEKDELIKKLNDDYYWLLDEAIAQKARDIADDD